MFGEMSLLENKPRSASAIAHEDCRLMTVNRQNFNQMVTTQPQLIAKLTTTLADRLWSMYRQLSNAAIVNPVARMMDMMALQVEKAKFVIAPNTPYQSDLTIQDLATMCGIPQDSQARAIYDFQNDPKIKVIAGKIYVPDVEEIFKEAQFLRRQTIKR